jgi:acyl-[acyl carrier protein]--UDP-N-acetylglucosamine O-acyltransferase
MALKSLNQFHDIRIFLLNLRHRWLRMMHGIYVEPGAAISLSSKLLVRGRDQIFIGADTAIAFKTLIYTYDIKSIGDECVIGAGAVVSADVNAGTMVGGNPARIIRRGIEVGRFGRLLTADATQQRLGVD